MPDASDHAIDEQDRIVAGLAGWGEARVAAFPGKSWSRGWLPTTYASKYGSSKTLPLRPARHGAFLCPCPHPRGVPSKLILMSFRLCRSNWSVAHPGGAPIHWANCCGVAGPYAYK